MVSAIVCCDNNWGIGRNGNLLINIPEDMKFFRETTNGKIIVMGSKTWDSLPNKPLPGRMNLVATSREPVGKEHGCFVSYEFVKEYVKSKGLQNNDIVIIGGGQIYKSLLKYCDEVYVTKVYKDFDADTYFPNIDEMFGWEIYEKSEMKEHNGIKYQFIKYRRKSL